MDIKAGEVFRAGPDGKLVGSAPTLADWPMPASGGQYVGPGPMSFWEWALLVGFLAAILIALVVVIVAAFRYVPVVLECPAGYVLTYEGSRTPPGSLHPWGPTGPKEAIGK